MRRGWQLATHAPRRLGCNRRRAGARGGCGCGTGVRARGAASIAGRWEFPESMQGTLERGKLRGQARCTQPERAANSNGALTPCLEALLHSLSAARHQAGHLSLGQLDLQATEVGLGHVLDLVLQRWQAGGQARGGWAAGVRRGGDRRAAPVGLASRCIGVQHVCPCFREAGRGLAPPARALMDGFETCGAARPDRRRMQPAAMRWGGGGGGGRAGLTSRPPAVRSTDTAVAAMVAGLCNSTRGSGRSGGQGGIGAWAAFYVPGPTAAPSMHSSK